MAWGDGAAPDRSLPSPPTSAGLNFVPRRWCRRALGYIIAALSLGDIMKKSAWIIAAATAVLLAAAPAAAAPWITLYSAPYYGGHSVVLNHPVPDLGQYGFNDRAQSARVHGHWQMCAAGGFGGDCVALYHDTPELKSYGMNRRANSVRPY